jgi:hypothetical protein
MFPDEPADLYDAVKWHRGLIEFYRMNLLRPVVCDNPVLCEGHHIEMQCHEQRLADLEAMLMAQTELVTHGAVELSTS